MAGAAVPLSIWRDPEFTGLSQNAQWLWFVLRTSAVGTKPFDPHAVVGMASGVTLAIVLDAEAELRRTKYRLAFIPRRYRPTIPKRTKEIVYARDGHHCQKCGATERLSLDHIWPYSLGGTDDEWNLRVLCISCNSSKGARV